MLYSLCDMGPLIDFNIALEHIGSSPFTVEAYRIRINTKLIQKGASIELRAHEIIFEADGEIDVTGEVGSPQGTAEPSSVAGQDGHNGVKAASSNGQPGGQITLICEHLVGSVRLIAKGGSASKGQNGSDGQKGKTGGPGGAYQKGGKGENGGNAGKGSDGGTGGPGGTILICCADSSRAIMLIDDSNVVGGVPGAPGDNGRPGAPGDPGSNGYIPGGGGAGRAAIGPRDIGNLGPGLPGTVPSPALPGQPGGPGKVIHEPSAIALDRLRKTMSSECLQLLLNQGQDAYYNTNHTEAAEILLFVSQVSA